MSAHKVTLSESVVRGTKHGWVALDGETVASFVDLPDGGVEVQPASILNGETYRADSVEDAVRRIALKGCAKTETQPLTGQARVWSLQRAETCLESPMPLTEDERAFLGGIAETLRGDGPVEEKYRVRLRNLFGRHCRHLVNAEGEPCPF